MKKLTHFVSNGGLSEKCGEVYAADSDRAVREIEMIGTEVTFKLGKAPCFREIGEIF